MILTDRNAEVTGIVRASGRIDAPTVVRDQQNRKHDLLFCFRGSVPRTSSTVVSEGDARQHAQDCEDAVLLAVYS